MTDRRLNDLVGPKVASRIEWWPEIHQRTQATILAQQQEIERLTQRVTELEDTHQKLQPFVRANRILSEQIAHKDDVIRALREARGNLINQALRVEDALSNLLGVYGELYDLHFEGRYPRDFSYAYQKATEALEGGQQHDVRQGRSDTADSAAGAGGRKRRSQCAA